MRIISINVHYQDGLGYQDYYLGKELHKMGHDVHFISSDRHFDYPDYEKTVQHIIGPKYIGVGHYINEYGVPVHRLAISNRLKKLTGRIWLKKFKQKVFELKPDLIISHGIFTFQSIRLAYWAHKLGCPIVYDDHTTINLIRKTLPSRFVFWAFRTLFSRKIMKSASKLVGISATCIDVMRDNFGMIGNKVSMIPLGTDTDIFKKDENLRKDYRKNYLSIDEDINTLVVVYTGKIYEDKNVHLIMEALNEINLDSTKDILIHIVGDIADSYKEKFEESIVASKYKVIYKKAIPIIDLPAVYNAADIAVWPDHLTNSTIDASACGCPIICSEYMPERVSYENGLLVKAGHKGDLKEKLAYILNNNALRAQMGANGIRYVEEQLSWKAIAKQFLSLNHTTDHFV